MAKENKCKTCLSRETCYIRRFLEGSGIDHLVRIAWCKVGYRFDAKAFISSSTEVGSKKEKGVMR